jgi:hypothetical protein
MAALVKARSIGLTQAIPRGEVCAVWGWKYWDVAIAIVGFLVQCGLAYMGLEMTHWKHKAQFGGLVLIGLIFTGVAVKRGIDSADKVQAQLNNIEHNTAHSQQAPIVNVPPPNVTISAPPEHTRIGWMSPPQQVVQHHLFPLVVGSSPELNLGYVNAGEYTVQNPKMIAEILFIPSKEADRVFSRHKKGLRIPEPGGGDLLPYTPGAAYNTFPVPEITKDHFDKLISGTEDLCAIGEVIWKDKTGRYETDMSGCYHEQSQQGDAGQPFFNWYMHAENNKETKLKN